MNINAKKVLTFDCYGTLIDWERGILNSFRECSGFRTIDDATILENFAIFETKVQQDFPLLTYPYILRKTMVQVAQALSQSVSDDDVTRFGNSIKTWPAFPDTHDALMEIKDHFKLIIVSNIDNESINYSQRNMDFRFDQVFTAQQMGYYKPDLEVFRYVLGNLESQGYEKSEILHVAQSLYHDHMPAKQIGLESIWIDRRYDKQGGGATPTVENPYIPEFKFLSLKEFASWITKHL